MRREEKRRLVKMLSRLQMLATATPANKPFSDGKFNSLDLSSLGSHTKEKASLSYSACAC